MIAPSATPAAASSEASSCRPQRIRRRYRHRPTRSDVAAGCAGIPSNSFAPNCSRVCSRSSLSATTRRPAKWNCASSSARFRTRPPRCNCARSWRPRGSSVSRRSMTATAWHCAEAPASLNIAAHREQAMATTASALPSDRAPDQLAPARRLPRARRGALSALHAIENASASLACQAGLNTWLCGTFRLAILLFNHHGVRRGRARRGLLNLLRPSIVLVALALAAAAFGLVLHNADLSALAAGVLILSLARPAPAPE